MDFPLDEDPGDDEKGLTALYKLSELTGVVLRETKNNNAVVPKDQWEQRGVMGGYVRLAFVPVSVTQAACYAYVYPAPEEELQEMLRKHELKKHPEALPKRATPIRIDPESVPQLTVTPKAPTCNFG